MKKILNINSLLWIVYMALLAVLFPHTAWAFGQFEPDSGQVWVPWAAALAFEAAIAALTGKLSKHIEQTPKRVSPRRKFSYRYLNAYSLGLVAALGLSSLANLAHAVQFGKPMAIFTEWGIPIQVYAIAFGAILPLISLTFARVLSNVVETEAEDDPELAEAKATIADLRKQLREANAAAEQANEKSRTAASRLGTTGILFADDKKDRIIGIHQIWPALTGSAIAVIAEASPAYVSEVLNSTEVHG
jgi:hypothetical protein